MTGRGKCVYKTLKCECLLAVYMKLYWRYKKDGKWTWKPAMDTETGEIFYNPYAETEEEE